MNIKQNQTFFHGIYLNPTSFFIGCKILKYLNDLIIGTFQLYCKNEHKQVKCNKITQDMEVCPNLIVFFLIYKVVHYLNDF